ncbi:MAG: FG-GAP repeat protein [Verrucomicrobiota bacterium]
MKHIELIAVPILATLLAGGTHQSHAQGATLIAQQAYLKASNTGVGDSFGYGVAVSGDTLVVGAYLEDSNATGVNGNPSNNSATDSGAAYVFVRNGTNWVQQAYLKASNTGANDWFGWSVAVSGDTVVVGARNEDSNATGVNGNQSNNSAGDAGAAYVFVRDGTNWTQQAYLKASNTGAIDVFGYHVAVSGDTVVVGAPGEDSNASGVNGNQSDNSLSFAGAAYVFVRSGTNWSQQAYLKASNPDFEDNFGSAVAISGDTVVVGADNESSKATGVGGDQTDNSASHSGAAYVFVRNGTNWTQQAYLKASNTGAADEFSAFEGGALAVSGDTIVVGSNHEDSDGIGVNGNQGNDRAMESGAAYIFVRSGTNWTQQAYLKASNAEAGDEFGLHVAISDDVVVVGGGDDSNATGVNGDQSNNTATDSCAAYVFLRTGTNWTQQAYLKASNTGANDLFGLFVAVSGGTVVVGAPGEDSNATLVNGNQTNNSATDSGAAYVFTGLGPAAPQLAIEQSADNVRILWPLAAANFVLDETNDLNASPIGWTQVPFPYQTNATDVAVTLPLAAGNKFYRLRKP